MSPPAQLSRVVLYRYDTSPYSVKTDNILLLKRIPYSAVNVSHVLPRPEITELLALTYRRIPILAIGNDIYCDTSLIASALERRFPPTEGFGTIFPPKKHGGSPDTGLLKAFTKYYGDAVFSCATILLPWDRFPQSFIDDRRTIAPNINVKAMVQSQGKALSTLHSHFALINEQLDDGREWLLDTELPSLSDIEIEFIFNWLRGFRKASSLFDKAKFPHAMEWLDRMNKFLKNARKEFGAPTFLAGNEAAQMIAQSPHESDNVVGFDAAEADRLKLFQGQMVSAVPDDPGLATIGKLVALNHEEFVIETMNTASNTVFHCHFPRIGFTPRAARQNKL